MKFGVVNTSTILSRFVLHTLQRNSTHLAVITRKTDINLSILKGAGGNWKRAQIKYCEQNKINKSRRIRSYHLELNSKLSWVDHPMKRFPILELLIRFVGNFR